MNALPTHCSTKYRYLLWKKHLTMHLLPTAQPSLKFDGVLPAKLTEIQGGFAGEAG